MASAILCVMDFSAASTTALQWAVRYACGNKIHLTVLYPYRLTRLPFNESALMLRKKIEDEAVRNFEVLEKDLLKGCNVSYDFKTEVGFLSDRVKEHVRKQPINFVVIAKNLKSTNKESFDELMETTDVPVVIVP